MSVRSIVGRALSLGALVVVFALPANAVADPASDLAVAEEAQSAASADVASAEGEVEAAEKALEPIERKAGAADRAAEDAQAEVEAVGDRLASERTEAAEEIAAAEADYEDEQSTHDTLTAIGIAIAAAALLLGAGAFVFSRVGKWPLSKGLTQALAAGLGVVLVGGLALALIPSSPEPPELSAKTEALALAAKGDPLDPPSRELIEAEAAARPLAAKAGPLDEAREEAEGSVADAEANVEDAEVGLSGANRQVRLAADVVEREERKAAKEAAFREEATSIDYDQLIKNPFRYSGERVVYTGQIFQIQEGLGSFMLLSVTDEGYGFWTDEIWVSGFGEIESAEEDVITVYGTVTGAEEYETAIGGSNYVPKVKAKYIDE
jgi:hypothetical protein